MRSRAHLDIKLSFRRIILYIVLIFFIIVTILPLWTGILTAFKSNQDLVLTTPLELPRSLTFDPLMLAFERLSGSLLYSLFFTIAATVLSCLIGSFTGYVLALHKFKGSNVVFILIIVGIFVPYQAVLVPLVLIMRDLHLFNSIGGLILTHTAYGIPICTLFFRSFYNEIPKSLIMAAKVDGAGILTTFSRIVLRLSVLPFIVAAVFQFTNIWNDFLFGLVISPGSDVLPAAIELPKLAGGQEALWNLQMAGNLWYILPTLIVYLLLGKYLMRGFMTGAVKG